MILWNICVDFFAKIINGQKQLIIFARRSIIDVWEVPNTPVDTRRHFSVYKMSIRRRRCRIDIL